MRCPFEVDLTDEEDDALQWLWRVIDNIEEKGPSHRSFFRARAARRAIDKISDHHQRMYDRAHLVLDVLKVQGESNV